MESSSQPNWTQRTGQAITVAIVALIAADRLSPRSWTLLKPLTSEIYNWTLILGAFALLLGILHVVAVHLRRIQQGRTEWELSLALVVSLITVFSVGILNPAGANSLLAEWIFDSIVAPGQATLFALLAFFMATAAYRMLRVDRPGGLWMLLGALAVILTQMPDNNSLLLPVVGPITDWLLAVPIVAIARGMLLAVGLAALVAALRLLLRDLLIR